MGQFRKLVADRKTKLALIDQSVLEDFSIFHDHDEVHFELPRDGPASLASGVPAERAVH
jgi:hypothetical protein